MADPTRLTVKVHSDRWWLTLCGDCRYPLSVGVFFGNQCPKCAARNPVKVDVISEATLETLAGELEARAEGWRGGFTSQIPSGDRALDAAAAELRKLLEGRGV